MAMSEKQAARWERSIKYGRAIFVLRKALLFFVIVTVLNLVVDFLFEKHYPDFSLGRVFVLAFTGIFIGLFTWWDGNSRYRIFLKEKDQQLARASWINK